jgi:hypothetical protein
MFFNVSNDQLAPHCLTRFILLTPTKLPNIGTALALASLQASVLKGVPHEHESVSSIHAGTLAAPILWEARSQRFNSEARKTTTAQVETQEVRHVLPISSAS